MKLVSDARGHGLGTPGDVVTVKDGYGRNFLLPQGYAVLATRGVEKQVAQLRRAREVREIRDLGQAREVAASLSGAERQAAGPRRLRGGRLFGSVSAADVAAAVLAAGGPKLDRRRVELSSPIKVAGTHAVTVKLHPEVTANGHRGRRPAYHPLHRRPLPQSRRWGPLSGLPGGRDTPQVTGLWITTPGIRGLSPPCYQRPGRPGLPVSSNTVHRPRSVHAGWCRSLYPRLPYRSARAATRPTLCRSAGSRPVVGGGARS